MLKKFGRGWVALLCSFGLIGAGAVLVTPTANALSGINWDSAWKHEIKPRADKRYYTKAAATKRFAPNPKVIRGAFALEGTAPAAAASFVSDVSFGWTFPTAPTVHVIAPGDPTPAGCRGSASNPGADPGNLCVFERITFNSAGLITCDVTNNCDNFSSRFGAVLFATSSASGLTDVDGSWAASPAGKVTASRGISPTSGRSGPIGR